MPMYPYRCSCKHEFDVLSKPSEIDIIKINCPSCDKILPSKFRQISKRGSFYGAAVEDSEFCMAMGCIVRNNKHRLEIAKSRGFEEIGNEKPETVHKYFDENRKAVQKKRSEDMRHDVQSALM